MLALLIWTGFESYGQMECTRDEPNTLTRPWRTAELGVPWTMGYPFNKWNAHVFQLSPDYQPKSDLSRQFTTTGSQASRQYKGYLVRDDNLFLPSSGINFDTQFSDLVGNATTDDNFFVTGNTQTDLSFGGCQVQLKHFGLFMRSRTIVPTTGIYRMRVGSDDGSNFQIFNSDGGVPGSAVLDLNGNTLEHDNWAKDPLDPNWDGYFNFIYDQNIRNYYAEFNANDTLFLQMSYYENLGGSRLSFSFDLYLGPGEIQLGGLQTGVYSFCGVNPDVPPFTSLVGGIFENGPVSEYKWQYATTSGENDANWVNIPGAIGEVYDIPAYDIEPWTGTRYYRRAASNVIIEEDGEGNQLSTTIEAYTNVIQVNLSAIAELDQSEYGENSWIGHLYEGIGDFSTDSYLGRYYENDFSFDQRFRASGSFPGESQQVNFIPDHGCPVYPNQFSVRYMMEYDALPGEYTVRLRGDDGFRLSVRDVDGNVLGANPWLINLWTNGGGKDITRSFEVENAGPIFFVLEYYENTGDQRITFDFISIILPVEWGRVFGKACGESNCLTWETLQEKNTSHFTVERSYDGQEWIPVGDAMAAQGFSTESTSYQFYDATFMQERSFYRVKQVDLDGSMDYSEIIRINNHSFKSKMIPYPNPTLDRVRFYSAEEVLMIQVTSIDARINLRANVEQVDQNLYELDFSQMQSSHYIITVVTNVSKESHKIIKR